MEYELPVIYNSQFVSHTEIPSQLFGMYRTEMNCPYILLDCPLSASDDRLDKVVLVIEIQTAVIM